MPGARRHPAERHVDAVHGIGRNPEGSGGVIFDRSRKLVADAGPQLLRVAGQCELRFGVVHRDDVAHPRGCRSSAGRTRIEDLDPGEGRVYRIVESG